MLRIHATTSYDQGAPNGGVNPATGQPYRLPTSVTTRSEYDDGTVNGTHTRTLTGYGDTLVGDATKTGWDLGQATSSTTDMDLSGNVSAGDITSRTRYDNRGRTVENRQPASVGGDAGTRATTYYTGSATGPAGCVNKPEWAGLTCKVGPAAQPSGQTMPTTTTTAYTWDLQTATEVDSSGSVTSTTTTSYDSKDGPPPPAPPWPGSPRPPPCRRSPPATPRYRRRHRHHLHGRQHRRDLRQLGPSAHLQQHPRRPACRQQHHHLQPARPSRLRRRQQRPNRLHLRRRRRQRTTRNPRPGHRRQDQAHRRHRVHLHRRLRPRRRPHPREAPRQDHPAHQLRHRR